SPAAGRPGRASAGGSCGSLHGEQAPPAVTEAALQVFRWQAMAVGKVLPVAGQQQTEVTQLLTLQALDQAQYLALGVRVFQRQAQVMQQATEQGAIEQAKGLARVFVPESLDLAGDIPGQALGGHFQAEQLARHGTRARLRQAEAAGEGFQPLAVAP